MVEIHPGIGHYRCLEKCISERLNAFVVIAASGTMGYATRTSGHKLHRIHINHKSPLMRCQLPKSSFGHCKKFTSLATGGDRQSTKIEPPIILSNSGDASSNQIYARDFQQWPKNLFDTFWAAFQHIPSCSYRDELGGMNLLPSRFTLVFK